MATLRVLTWPDPGLSRPAAPVGPVTDARRNLVADMFETMCAAPGRGLAAPQVGVGLRLFVMDAGGKEGAATPLALLDPVLLAVSEERDTAEEGCPSIPGVPALVERSREVTLAFTTLASERVERRLVGAAARIAQHELDHLDGLRILDRIGPEACSALAPALARLAGAA